MVEHDLAKVGVAGSTPVSRSIFLKFSFTKSDIQVENCLKVSCRIGCTTIWQKIARSGSV